MATPHVTGAVAFMRSVDPTISVDQVFADLIQTARPLVPGGRNAESGYGLLQVGPAVDLAAGGSGAPLPTPTPNPDASPTHPDTDGQTPAPTPDPRPVPRPRRPRCRARRRARPSVLGTNPRNGTRNVSRSTQPQLIFSVAVAGISTRTVTMLDLSRGRRVLIRVSYSASSWVVTIKPTVRLGANHSYRILVAGITSSSDGIPIRQTFAVTFRTGYH